MSEAEEGAVYVLRDPRTNDPKYVGATVDVEQRLAVHKSSPTNPEMEQWIESLLDDDLEPEVDVVRSVPADELREEELEVARELAEEWDLLNANDHVPYSGGGGGRGTSTGNAVRPRISEPVDKILEEIMEEYHLPNKGEAIRYALIQAGYDL